MSSAISSHTHTNGSEENYLNTSYGIRSWLLTLDHKRIGILYLVTPVSYTHLTLPTTPYV